MPLVSQAWPAELVVFADAKLLAARARTLGQQIEIVPWTASSNAALAARPGRLLVADIPLRAPSAPGHPDPRNSPWVLELLKRASAGCRLRQFAAVEGGDLGWTGPGNFVPEFDKTMNALQLDQISEPFKTQFGWHILQVKERRVYDATADKQRQEAVLAIRNSKLGDEAELWTRRLRDEAFVEIRI